jgi:hypothetical protein|tara:strand:+ start:6924 stop:7190 length:267 start_codon:yes stop_codon:yes gene_type:complete
MENNAAAKMIEDMQERFPGLTPEVAAQTILVESLKACQSIMDLTRLPVDPRVLSQLRDGGLIDQAEWERIMAMLDPQSGVPSIDASGK